MSKLITLAIYTVEKAQILKDILESEGIKTYIHSINADDDTVSAGVRLRINEGDLAHALRVIEKRQWINQEESMELYRSSEMEGKQIVIPIDFSDYSFKACQIGFNYAQAIGGKIILFHSFQSSYLLSKSAFVDQMDYEEDTQANRKVLSKERQELVNFCEMLNLKIAENDLPDIPFEVITREGEAGREITLYCNNIKPLMIILGARGKNVDEINSIGSVTAQVIETCESPILIIPENTPFTNLEKVKKLGFAINYQQRDLLAFDRLTMYFDLLPAPEITLFNVSTQQNESNEKLMTDTENYLRKQYPQLDIKHSVLADGAFLLALEIFVQQEQIDLIVLSTYKRNIFARMFGPSKAKKMLFQTNTPLLAIRN